METEERSRDSGPIPLYSDDTFKSEIFILIYVDDEDETSTSNEGNKGLESKSIDVDLIFLRSVISIEYMGRYNWISQLEYNTIFINVMTLKINSKKQKAKLKKKKKTLTHQTSNVRIRDRLTSWNCLQNINNIHQILEL